MTHPRRCTAIFLFLAAPLALLIGFLPAAVAGAAAGAASSVSVAGSTNPQLPQTSAAQSAAQWLAGQFNAQGFIPTTPGSSEPNLSDTAEGVLALAAADVDLPVARRALTYLQANVDSYVTAGGADGPGQLALLMLDAEALGDNPQSFGGTNLVSSLLATEQSGGADSGLFGTETQLATYLAGTYDQGLALAALAGAGVQGAAPITTAVAWLIGQQCPGGGWTLPDQALNPCDGTPGTFPSTGPDTNSTALAVEGLAAQGQLSAAASASALAFFTAGQDADAGWSYYPGSAAMPQTTQPTSTALVIQALLALGTSPTASSLTKGAATPVSSLLSFRVTTGPGTGAFSEVPGTTSPNLFATYEAAPALAGLAIPFEATGLGYWEVASDGGVFSFGDATFDGSEGGKHLDAPIVGIASTPDGHGYWEVASDGGVFSFGDATFDGSEGGKHLDAPIVGIASTPDGHGYWEVASDGGVFSFGDATFDGSEGGKHLDAPIVGIASTPDGHGYWEVASDGGVFSFGDATFDGSEGGKHLDAPIVGIASTPDGHGYWEVASDGGVFSFGDATFDGSEGGKHLDASIVGIASTPDGHGYWEVASDGGVFSFGDATFDGSEGGKHLTKPVVGIAATPAPPTPAPPLPAPPS